MSIVDKLFDIATDMLLSGFTFTSIELDDHTFMRLIHELRGLDDRQDTNAVEVTLSTSMGKIKVTKCLSK